MRPTCSGATRQIACGILKRNRERYDSTYDIKELGITLSYLIITRRCGDAKHSTRV